MIQLDSRFLRGSYTPIVTPFTDQQVDHEVFARLVLRQAEGGSDGVVVTGTSGEPSMLTVAERCELFRTAVSAADGALPVVAATGSQSLAETLELTHAAQDAGADAVLVVTPYYSKPPQRGLVQYFREVSSATDLPVLIYHIPGRAGVELAIDSVLEIADSCENLVGMKHASPDLGYAARLMRATDPEFRFFVGLEELSLPLLAMGADGLMNAVGNIAPRPVSRLCSAVREGNLTEAQQINEQLAELNEAVFWDTNPIPIKYLMRRLGLLESNEHRLPMMSASPELEARLDSLLGRTEHLFATA